VESIWLGVFALFSVIHLIFCYIEHEFYRKFTKVILVPILMLYVIESGSFELEYALIMALLGSFLGDIFLLNQDNKVNFLAGLSSFLVAHVFYIMLLESRLDFNDNILIVLVFGLLVMAVLAYMTIRRVVKSMTIPVILYSLTLFVVTLFSGVLLINSPSWYNASIFIGSLLFMFSDSLVAYSLFIKDFKRKHLYIMVTYLLAQLLIVIGLVNF